MHSAPRLGCLYNRQNPDATLNPFTSQTPLAQNPVVCFAALATPLSSAGLLFPEAVLSRDRSGKVPTVWHRHLNAIPYR